VATALATFPGHDTGQSKDDPGLGMSPHAGHLQALENVGPLRLVLRICDQAITPQTREVPKLLRGF
jgi:hypothetical protein